MMNEQRRLAYLNLTQILLTCPSDKVSEIVDANQELIDSGWVQMIEQAAVRLAEQGNQNGADKLNALRDYAAQLVALVDTKEITLFWAEVWQATLESKCDRQVLYPLLQAHLDKLNDNLTRAMRIWATAASSAGTPEEIAANAGLIVNFSNLIAQFPHGSRASNLEIAIAGYELALTIFTRNVFPEQWAIVQNGLGIAYNNRIRGERAENLEQAIACYHNALQVYSREAFPERWALLQNNLGTAYIARLRGDQAENLEQAIACFQQALQIYTRNAFPGDWAMAQSNLGGAYWTRIRGDRSQNLERAIDCFRKSLQVRTRSTLPKEWAEGQKNLGIVYWNRLCGNQARNRERAINYLTNALQVYTKADFPEKWAETKNILGVVYWERTWGNKAENLEQAINCYQNALEVYTQEDFPEKWSYTKNNLAVAYTNRILGERSQNLNQAVDCCQDALLVQNCEAFPQAYVRTLFNLGIAYQESRQFDEAYIAFESAINTIEFLRGEIVSRELINEVKQKLAEEWNNLYQRMVEVCLEIHNYPKAIEYVERSKARSLVELLATRDLYPKGQMPKQVQNKVQQLRLEIDIENRRLAADATPDYTRVNQLRQQYNEIYSYEPIRFEQIQNLINDSAAIVQWYIFGDCFRAFIITRHSQAPFVWTSSIEDLKNLQNWSTEYLSAYYAPRWVEAKAQGKELRTQWGIGMGSRLQQLAEIMHIDDILSHIPTTCDELILVPYRYLHLLPLHALPVIPKLRQRQDDSRLEGAATEGGYCLLDEFSGGVRYAPSCELLQQTQNRKRSEFNHIFAIQNPTHDLTYTGIEVAAIRQHFQHWDVLSEDDARKEAISDERLRIAHCAHFSCHGYFNFEDPLLSALLLADAHISQMPVDTDLKPYFPLPDGRAIALDKCLTLADLFTLDLNQCRLVTLSACETGLTDFQSLGDEYISLSSGFLYAGSSSVVHSLWEVNELSSAFLMIKFYENLQDPKNYPNVAIALNQAQVWLRKATNKQLLRWLKEKESIFKKILGYSEWLKLLQLLKQDVNAKPCESPYYWAAFCAIGQ
ncbi:CHAT domain-containing protein [Argonema antarcticum]|uniref:CHAT domain-containing protein n=1 Tax=Argonema antarcticum TaxID=2942763 RepID=UPI002013ABE9|nr:CHAT domain-containing tetratricopeptide repeat protein [Argonema antarcticum]MCL1474717.1 CHAT domain-containing protein [Argonema antarcticum A004/B2]